MRNVPISKKSMISKKRRNIFISLFLYFAKFCTNMKYHKIKCDTFIFYVFLKIKNQILIFQEYIDKY